MKNRVRQLRKALGWSQDRLAREIGVHQTTIHRWETGDRVPHRVFLEAIERLVAQQPANVGAA